MLIMLAGLQGIPGELYDAAVVDGAGPLQTWWYITIPSLRPTFVFLIITGTIDAFSRFSDLDARRPIRHSTLAADDRHVHHQTAFDGNDFNLASAATVILLLSCW
jgi:ABC-type sugar transport system permease subunit